MSYNYAKDCVIAWLLTLIHYKMQNLTYILHSLQVEPQLSFSITDVWLYEDSNLNMCRPLYSLDFSCGTTTIVIMHTANLVIICLSLQTLPVTDSDKSQCLTIPVRSKRTISQTSMDSHQVM